MKRRVRGKKLKKHEKEEVEENNTEVGEKIILETKKAEWGALQQPAVSTWNLGENP